MWSATLLSSIFVLMEAQASGVHAFAFTRQYMSYHETRGAHRKSATSLYMSSNDDEETKDMPPSVSVLGTNLQPCNCNVRSTGIGTGWYRNGYCSTGPEDLGRHTVCCEVTEDFLQYSKSVGNDLSTPMPQYMFPGLKEGDRWCLCAARWVQACEAGMAPKVVLSSTHEKTLSVASLDMLRKYALDLKESDAAVEMLNRQRAALDKLLSVDVDVDAASSDE